jgi:acyl-coenzyme A thioesterase PaaI-like protein
LDPEHERAHVDLVDATRRLQDAVMASNAPAATLAKTARSVRRAADELMRHVAPWPGQVAGMQFHLPGRGQVLTPPVHLDELTERGVRARWTFTQFYDGGGGVVLGGAVPLVVDEVCGRLANHVSGDLARTACLKVDFRNVTRVGQEITLVASVERLEGRKIFVAGSLRDAESLLCDVSGLFIRTRPVERDV